MPRAPRRAANPGRDGTTTTPTRPTATNAITAAIPPFMLETPPHAAFLTTPIPPSNNPGQVAATGANAPPRHHGQRHQTPTDNDNDGVETSQVSHNALTAATSETGHIDEQSYLESIQHDAEDIKQLKGLRDISSLATWTLSSAKPGCALAQLRNPSPTTFWQSDGPQPHTLTLHFFKLVAIVKMRIHLDFELDESYTPTKMKFFAGMSEGGLVEFGSWEVIETTDPETGETQSSIEGIRGWIDIPLKGVGGRESRYHEHEAGLLNNDLGGQMTDHMTEPRDELEGGDVLKAMVVQVRICENHQNGKDTHVRGFQVFARDTNKSGEIRTVVRKPRKNTRKSEGRDGEEERVVALRPAAWMDDPEIR